MLAHERRIAAQHVAATTRALRRAASRIMTMVGSHQISYPSCIKRDLVTPRRGVSTQEQDVLTVCGEMIVSSPNPEVSRARENTNARKFSCDEAVGIVA